MLSDQERVTEPTGPHHNFRIRREFTAESIPTYTLHVIARTLFWITRREFSNLVSEKLHTLNHLLFQGLYSSIV